MMLTVPFVPETTNCRRPQPLISTEETKIISAIYTQLSDVEDETNGILTYDRKINKVSKERMLEIAERLKI